MLYKNFNKKRDTNKLSNRLVDKIQTFKIFVLKGDKKI